MFEDRTLAREVWRGERPERVVGGGGVSVRALTHRSGLDVRLAFPGPRQEFVDPVYGMPSDHAGDHILEVSVGLDAVELAGLDQ